MTSGAEKLTKDYRELVHDPEIDAVFICTSTDTHVEIILNSLQRRKTRIFCEKPISFSEEETLKAYEAVQKAGVKFQVGFNGGCRPELSQSKADGGGEGHRGPAC